MIAYVLRRLRTFIPTVLLILVMVFLLRLIIPGGPAEALAGGSGDAETIARINQRFGLDRPLYQQLWDYLSGLVRGDLGVSYLTGQPVTDVIGPRLGITFELVLGSFVLTVVFGVGLGTIAAVRRDSVVGRVIIGSTGLGVSVPVFWLSTVASGYLGGTLKLFPAVGVVDVENGLAAHLHSVILPMVLLALPSTALITRHVYSAMSTALRSTFVRTAWAMGLPAWRVYLDLAMRASAGPIITFLPLVVAMLVGELVIVENIFVIDGLGSAIVHAVMGRDYGTLQAIVLMLALLVLTLNLLADLAMAALDPRVRKAMGSEPSVKEAIAHAA